MIKRKKVMYSIVGIAIASTVFTTTAFTNVLNSAGYDNYKKALVKTFTTANNFTLTSATSVTVDGRIVNSSQTKLKTDGKYQSSTNSNTYRDGSYESHFISQKNYTASKHVNNVEKESAHHNEDGEWMAYKVDEVSNRVYFSMGYIGARFGSLTPSQIRFYELLADTLTGDTKNYVITNGNDISINLSENQVPELANLGLAAIVESNNRFRDEDNIDEDFPISKDIIMKNFSLNAKLADNGFIEDTEVIVILAGKDFKDTMHEIVVKFSFAFANIGNTVPDTLDEATLAKALKYANDRNKEDTKEYVHEENLPRENLESNDTEVAEEVTDENITDINTTDEDITEIPLMDEDTINIEDTLDIEPTENIDTISSIN